MQKSSVKNDAIKRGAMKSGSDGVAPGVKEKSRNIMRERIWSR